MLDPDQPERPLPEEVVLASIASLDATLEQVAQPMKDPRWPRPGLQVEVFRSPSIPEAWQVEAIHHAGEGEIYTAIFLGPLARERAHNYSGLFATHVLPND